ncbi:MAG: holo-ACP synthase [Burkholderiales bacterium]|nr:holo-ACP synthase [Burkholderiales bacterium]
MIYGIGHDIVENRRIERLYNRYGETFIKKILSSDEQLLIKTKVNKIKFIAKRFAAKEAFAKACGTGLRSPISLTNISILNDNLGKPTINFSNHIQKLLCTKGIAKCHISLSDEEYISSAFVVLEKD